MISPVPFWALRVRCGAWTAARTPCPPSPQPTAFEANAVALARLRTARIRRGKCCFAPPRQGQLRRPSQLLVQQYICLAGRNEIFAKYLWAIVSYTAPGQLLTVGCALTEAEVVLSRVIRRSMTHGMGRKLRPRACFIRKKGGGKSCHPRARTRPVIVSDPPL